MAYGFEILYKLVSGDFKRKSDALVAYVHHRFVANNFRCIGCSVEVPPSPDVEGSECLPEEWNKNDDDYTLAYIREKKFYLLKGVPVEDSIIFNLVRRDEKNASDISVEVSRYVDDDYCNFTSAYNNLENLQQVIDADLLDPFIKPPPPPKVEEYRRPPPPSHDPLRVHPPQPPGGYVPYPDNPVAIGHGDLDPLGGGGPGMLMDPRGLPHMHPVGPGGFRPRGVPPGARYLPTHPFHPHGPRGPNPDHLPPPGWGGGGGFL